MTAVAFDTLKLARSLESAGFSRDQADGAAAALADSFLAEIATKSDLAELRISLEGRMASLEGKISNTETGLEGKISNTETGLDGKITKLGADLRTEIASLRSSTAQWIISAVFFNAITMLGGIAAVWQLAHK